MGLRASVRVSPAGVGVVLAHAPPEEALAAVAAGGAVVLPRGSVGADGTQAPVGVTEGLRRGLRQQRLWRSQHKQRCGRQVFGRGRTLRRCFLSLSLCRKLWRQTRQAACYSSPPQAHIRRF